MKSEEAIEILKERIKLTKKVWLNVPEIIEYREALELAVVAIKKDISQKPVRELGIPNRRCPNCKSGVTLRECDRKFPSCQWCGQKLDWSEENGI